MNNSIKNNHHEIPKNKIKIFKIIKTKTNLRPFHFDAIRMNEREMIKIHFY